MKSKIGIYLLFLLIAPILLISIGCGSSASTTVVTTTTTVTTTSTSTTLAGRQYYPNTDGYSWTYRKTSTSSTTTDATIYIDRFTFSGTAMAGSIEAQILKQENISPYPSTFENYKVITADYVKQLSPEAYTLLVFPLCLGASWTLYGSDEATVISFESVTVPAGTFNECFKVRMVHAVDSWADVWYAKDVGMVKAIAFSGTPTYWYQTETELTEKNF